jgi:hypothetical protein
VGVLHDEERFSVLLTYISSFGIALIYDKLGDKERGARGLRTGVSGSSRRIGADEAVSASFKTVASDSPISSSSEHDRAPALTQQWLAF